MTLHDRIMAILDGPYSGDDSWNDGYVAAVEEAADIATEAGELMAEMAEALNYAADDKTLDDGSWLLCVAALTKYNAYKEQSK